MTERTPSTEPPPSAEKYRAILAEAERIQGVSLWRDAWRRLRRNWFAMASLNFLVLLCLASLLTPLLPLQSSMYQDPAERRLLPPNLDAIALPKYEILQNQLQQQTELENPEAYALVFNAYINDNWGEKRNRMDRQIIRLRMAIFGDWCIPSLCGTDSLGRDLLSRLFWGSRVSLTVGIVAAMVSLVIGVTFGAIAGFLGGLIDDIMMRAVDILYSIPFIFVVIFLITFLNDDKWKEWLVDHGIDRIMIFYLLIGAIFWLTMARVVRGQIISLRNEQFVEAAQVLGASRARIIFLHLIPNVLSVVIIYLTLTIPSVMLFEAFLSFLGLGVEAPDISWGLLANEGVNSITPIRTFWWMVVFPGAALAATLYALNFLGDGLRDALDPRLKNS